MKKNKDNLRGPDRITENNLQIREIGKGFILNPGTNDMPTGRRLVTAFADQHNRSYILMNGTYEPITEQHRYLAVD
jgi:hypothetical protein